MSFTYVLKDRRLNTSLEGYVSGKYRMNFIKRPVIEKEDDTTPELHERVLEMNMKEEVVKLVKEKRSIGVQTLFRESEAQTVPAPLGEIERDGSFLEILELKEFSYGNGLPVTMHEIELIAKAREKRAFNDALPPLSDEACFHLRSKLTKEQEFREWTQKEQELKDINDQRLLKLQQLLQEREKVLEEQRVAKIDELKGKKDEEVETQIIKTRKTRVKIIRGIEKAKENFNRKDKFKRDIILQYASFGSKVYAPLTRDGHNPDRTPFRLELQSEYLTSYEGLSEIEGNIIDEHRKLRLDMNILERQYMTGLRKGEKTHLSAIEDAFKSIKNQEQKQREEKELEELKKREEENLAKQKNKPEEKTNNQFPIPEEIILFQRLLRGRKEQILMFEGKRNRSELIKELRAADNLKSTGISDEENKLIDNYIEKLTNGVVDAIQGQTISQSLDFLSKQLVRIREEQKINAIVMYAENERRKREAEEMGRRQAENIIRDRQDLMYKELLEVNQATMDSYINNLFSNTVNNVSKKQVMREIEIKANKLNKIVDRIENDFIGDDVRVRDLVSSFIIPEIDRKKVEDRSKYRWTNFKYFKLF
jgi:hypothetical protein